MKLSTTTKQPVHGYDTIKVTNGSPAGTIIWSANATVPTGYLLCNGSAVDRLEYPDLFEAIGVTYGEGDGTSTFNLPNLIGKFIEGSSTAGIEHEAGLPNITGSPGGTWQPDEITLPTGSFALTGRTGSFPSGSPHPLKIVDMDASRSSSIYGKSETVQPPAVTALPCIKAYNSTVLSKSNGVVEWWHEGSEWYRLWADGWIEQGGQISTSGSNAENTITFHKSFTTTNYFFSRSSSCSNYSSATLPFAYTGYIEGTKNLSDIKIYVHQPCSPKIDWCACGY